MKRLLISLLSVGVIGTVAFVGTSAFFSDEEISTGNTFEAGAIDLQLTNETSASYEPGDTSDNWTDFDDVNDQVLMSFADIKPGDWGENTIGFNITSNEAWMCAELAVDEQAENTILDPEADDGDVSEDIGELADFLTVLWWEDDGDNVLEQGEDVKYGGPRPLAEWLALGNGDSLDLTFADSVLNWSADAADGDPIDPDVPFYLGVAWCMGEMTIDTDTAPGWSCDGENVDNTSQSDSVTATLAFSAVQTRNNDSFLCPENQPTEPEPIDAEGPFDGWNGDGALIWQAEARFGSNSLSGDWEVGVGTNTQTANQSNTQSTWPDDVAVPFTVSYDGSSATFTVNGNSATYTVGSVNNSADLNIIAGKVSSGAGDSITLSDLDLNGSPLNPDTFTDTDDVNASYIVVSSEDLSGGFELTGMVAFDWTNGTTAGSRPAFQVQIRD